MEGWEEYRTFIWVSHKYIFNVWGWWSEKTEQSQDMKKPLEMWLKVSRMDDAPVIVSKLLCEDVCIGSSQTVTQLSSPPCVCVCVYFLYCPN